jgi:hypothetical protein
MVSACSGSNSSTAALLCSFSFSSYIQLSWEFREEYDHIMIELEVCPRLKPNAHRRCDYMVVEPLTLEADAAIWLDGEVETLKWFRAF